MANQAAKKQITRLRFPEFMGQTLHEVQLGDVTAESGLRNGEKLPATAVMGVSKTEGIVPMEERIIASDIARYKVARKNWFAYNPMRLNIGSIARWKGDADILVSPDYIVFRCLDDSAIRIEPDYLDHFRRSEFWDAFVSEGGDGGVRVRIYYKDLARLELALPSPKEQQKIADCLTSLDELIAAQARKVETLKTYKRGLMQQLFPREGEMRPRLRFPEFRDAPAWEHKELRKLAVRGSGHTPSRSNAEYYNGGIKWVSLADSHRLDAGYIAETSTDISELGIAHSSAVLHAAGSVILCRDAGIGKVAILKEQMAVSQHFMVWTCDKEVLSNWFLYYRFQTMKKLLEQVASGSTIKTIGLPFFEELTLLLPSLAEQQRIADLLAIFDFEIAAESEKLDGLRIHKTGLMQQVFPAPEVAL